MKNFIFLFILCACFSCSQEGNKNLENQKERIDNVSVLKFQSKRIIKDLAENGIKKSRNLPIISKEFTSLLSVIPKDDPILSTYTKEERNYIVSNNITYYELMGYDNIIPNKNFAKLLNKEGEIVLKDSIYKITPIGTFSSLIQDRNLLNTTYEKVLKDSLLISKPYNRFNISPRVTFIRLNQIKTQRERDYSKNLNAANSKNIISLPKIKSSYEDIPVYKFPTFSKESHTFVGSMLGHIFGDRSVKHDDFMKGYRVKGSLYDYSYGVYSEVGAYVAMRKKRGGFFKKFNGWKATNADELCIFFRDLVLEIDLNKTAKENLPRNIQQSRILGSSNLYIKGFNQSMQCLDVCISSSEIEDFIKGFSISDNLKQQFINFLNSRIYNPDKYNLNVNAYRLITENKVYLAISNQNIHAYNTDQLRKVLSSNFSFIIGLNSNGLYSSLYYTLLRNLDNISYKKIVAGKVILAGKKGDQWGGMIIH